MKIIFSSDNLTLYHVPEHALLEASYGNIYRMPLPVIKEQFQIIVDAILDRDVHYLLLDSSKNDRPEDFALSKELAYTLAQGLLQTNLKKVARLRTRTFIIEATTKSYISEVKDNLQLPFQIENFDSREEALDWLRDWENMHLT